MPIKADDTSPRRTDAEQTMSVVFRLLAHYRRRTAIRYLATGAGTTPVSDVADQIALLEGEHTHEHYARICVSLVHNHLPMLSDAGVVEYDREQEVVALRDQAAPVISYLDMAADVDLSDDAGVEEIGLDQR
jgi:hypothetical protein